MRKIEVGLLNVDIECGIQTEVVATRALGFKSYELTDHLGNVRATFSDVKTIDASNKEIVKIENATDYYPFGMEMPKRTFFDASKTAYRFGFNGKERDNDIDGGNGFIYDYGFRIYNARIAKFLSMDPLFKSFPWNSTYAFAENDVIRSIDLDGGEKRVVIQETGINGKPYTVKYYYLVKITGSNGPLGTGTLYIQILQNKNITKVHYANYGNDGKKGETASFQYRAYTDELPKLADYDLALPNKWTWKSDVSAGAETSLQFSIGGYGTGYKFGVSASFFETTITESGSERKWFGGVEENISITKGAFNISQSYNNEGEFKFSGSVFDVVNTSTSANLFSGKIEGKSDFTVFKFSAVDIIGGNLSFKYNPSKDILFQNNTNQLKKFTPDNALFNNANDEHVQGSSFLLNEN